MMEVTSDPPRPQAITPGHGVLATRLNHTSPAKKDVVPSSRPRDALLKLCVPIAPNRGFSGTIMNTRPLDINVEILELAWYISGDCKRG